MASIFGIQFGSRFVSTKKFEASLLREREDFERFSSFESSELLKRYMELDALIHSGEFEKKVRELKTARYKDTEQWRQLDQYNVMKRSSDIKTYLKFTKAGLLERMKQIGASDSYQSYLAMRSFVNSGEFHSAKVKKDFKQTEAYTKLKTYEQLSKDPNIRFYIKTEKKANFKTVTNLEGSERLKTFFKLEAIIQSQLFQEHRYKMEDKKRFKKSEEASLIEEFESLKKNEEIKWYLNLKKKSPFKEFRKWSLTFEDDFDAMHLDTSKWMTGYYWGKALMNDAYALAGEKQFFQDGNIELRDSVARINTRREATKGKVWDAAHGFTTQPFEYTSGLISTGQSFRQKYGKFEAKVRYNQSYPLLNAFWMVGEKMTPQIDVVKSAFKKGKSVECGVHVQDTGNKAVHQMRKVSGAKFNNNFYIYSLEWSPEAIVWRINGQEVHRETKHIPDEAMYLAFCTILPENPAESDLPGLMEIDWIRCYQKKKE
jgi:beta-glucanase (GH16 family)